MVKTIVNLISDSQGRHIGDILKNQLNPSQYSIKESVFPGFSLSALIARVNQQKGLKKNRGGVDWLFILGGFNNVDSPQAKRDLFFEYIAELQHRQPDKKIVFIEVPYRHDKPTLNPKVDELNKRLLEKCIKNKWGFIAINCVIEKELFTRPGLHFRPEAKHIVGDLIASYIKSSPKN